MSISSAYKCCISKGELKNEDIFLSFMLRTTAYAVASLSQDISKKWKANSYLTFKFVSRCILSEKKPCHNTYTKTSPLLQLHYEIMEPLGLERPSRSSSPNTIHTSGISDFSAGFPLFTSGCTWKVQGKGEEQRFCSYPQFEAPHRQNKQLGTAKIKSPTLELGNKIWKVKFGVSATPSYKLK